MATKVGEIEIAVVAKLDKLERDLARMEKKVDGAAKKSGRTVDKLKAKFKSLGASSAKSILAATTAFLGFAKVMRDMVQNARDDEQGMVRLEAALAKVVTNSKEVTQELYAQAEAFDRLSSASQTEIVNAQAFLVNMGVMPEKMEEAISASLNMAAALGWDLTTAARNVGKTMGGFAGELGEVIPELKDLDSNALKAGKGITLLNEKFAGQAQANLESFTGRSKELADAWEVFTANVGKAITQSPQLADAMDELNASLRDPDTAQKVTDWGLLFQAVGAVMGASMDGAVAGVGRLSDALSFLPGDPGLSMIEQQVAFLAESIRKDNEKLQAQLEEREMLHQMMGGSVPPMQGPALPPSMRPKTVAPVPEKGLTEKQLKVQRETLEKLRDAFLKHKKDLRAISNQQLVDDIAAIEKTVLDENEKLKAIERAHEMHSIRMVEINAEEKQERIEAEKALWEETEKLLEENKTNWDGFYDFLRDGFEDALADMVISGEISFKQLGEAFLREFVQRAISAPLDNIFDSIASVLSIGAGLGGGVEPVRPDFISGGIAGDFIGKSATPLKSNFASDVQVNVINASGEKATTRESKNADGTRQIEVMIGKAVATNIHRGGTVDAAIRNSYGLKRPGSHG